MNCDLVKSFRIINAKDNHHHTLDINITMFNLSLVQNSMILFYFILDCVFWYMFSWVFAAAEETDGGGPLSLNFL